MTLNIKRNGVKLKNTMLSTGEKLTANLVWVFAVNRLMSRFVSFNILQIDEPFKSLSPEDSSKVTDLLLKLAGNDNIFISLHIVAQLTQQEQS